MRAQLCKRKKLQYRYWNEIYSTAGQLKQTKCFNENHLQTASATSLMLGTRKSHGSSFWSSGNVLLYSSCSSLNLSCTKCNCQRQQHATIGISRTRNHCKTAATYWERFTYCGSKFIQHSAFIESFSGLKLLFSNGLCWSLSQQCCCYRTACADFSIQKDDSKETVHITQEAQLLLR